MSHSRSYQVLRTEQLRKNSEHVAELAKIDSVTRWAESGGKQTLQSKLLREKKVAEEEMSMLNKELKTRRRAKLQDFYAAQEEIYEKELNEKGLAFIKGRV
jgi:hypothetical protein